MSAERVRWILWSRWKFLTEHPGSWAHLTAFASPDSVFEGVNYLYARARVASSHVGRRSYLAADATAGNALIGRYCSIGPGARIGGLGAHAVNMLSTHPAFFSIAGQAGRPYTVSQRIVESQETRVGNDVWIGARAIILDGKTVGDGAIVGAGAVVTRDVAPYSVVGGVPARVIRMRFGEETVAVLRAFRWWEFSEKTLKILAEDFASPEPWTPKRVEHVWSRARALESNPVGGRAIAKPKGPDT